jgi:hypothetical protein
MCGKMRGNICVILAMCGLVPYCGVIDGLFGSCVNDNQLYSKSELLLLWLMSFGSPVPFNTFTQFPP